MGKRKRTDQEIEKRIKKLKRKLEKQKGSNENSENTPEHGLGHVLPNMPEKEILVDLFGNETDDQNQSETNIQSVGMEEQADVLDSRVLEILGEHSSDNDHQGPPIHNSVAERWIKILSTGLNKEEKSQLLKAYPAPANCSLMNAPQLNLEIKAALPESICRKDKILEIKQKQLSAALSCLGQAINILIKGQDHQALKAVSNAARLLCDQQYFESLTRRLLILGVLNKTTKDAIQGVKPDEWLFGKDLSDRIKACKAVNKQASELKSRPYRPNTRPPAPGASTSSPLNWRGPSHPQHRRPQGYARGGPRLARPTLTQQRGHNFRRN